MIFVATGTTGFDVLVERMDRLALTLAEEVVMQIGSGRYIPRQAEYFRFAPSLEPYYERASLVVSHGGAATCLEVLGHGKPLIALSNPDRYDQHQQDVLGVLAGENYLIWCKDLNALPEVLRRAREWEFKRYVVPKCEIHTVVKEFLQNQGWTCRGRSWGRRYGRNRDDFTLPDEGGWG
jgi:beta-1,4-N-acetylglucosaminyltransferase